MPIRKRIKTTKPRKLKRKPSTLKRKQVLDNGICVETRLRIKVLLGAYTYELCDWDYMHDSQFDKLCLLVNLDRPTHRPDLDKWFKENFSPHTGQWIHNFPELGKLDVLCKRLQSYNIVFKDRDKSLKVAKKLKKKKKRKRIV